MSNRLKSIIKRGVTVLLEVDISDLPQKQVVKDKGVHDTAVAQATSDNITQKFRELGIDVPMNELATVELLKKKSPFNISFKLKDESSIFGDKKEVKGKARVIDKESIDGNLTLEFISSDSSGGGVSIKFDPKGLKNMRPETGQPMVVIKENVKYNVILSKLDVGISLPNSEGKIIDVNKNQVSYLQKMTSKSGKDYFVASNPLKQNGVKEGSSNVTIVRGPQINKSFAIPNGKLSTDKKNHVYFPKDKNPLIIKKEEEGESENNVMIITSLPDIGGSSKEGGEGLRFSKNKPIQIDVNLRIEKPADLSAFMSFGVTELNKKLMNVEAVWASSQPMGEVLKITLNDGSVVMLKPQKLYPNPQFLGNWKNLHIQIGKFAGRDEKWDKDVMGTATLKLRK